jgi:hypothetical protein
MCHILKLAIVLEAHAECMHRILIYLTGLLITIEVHRLIICESFFINIQVERLSRMMHAILPH